MMLPGKARYLALLGAALLGGCILIPPDENARVPPPGYSNRLAPLNHAEAPVLRVAKTGAHELRQYREFTVAPATCAPGMAAPAHSEAPLFTLRNQLEARGYTFAPGTTAGFVALLDYTPEPRGKKRGWFIRRYRPRDEALQVALPPPLAELNGEARERCTTNYDWGGPPPQRSLQPALADPYYPTLRVTMFDRSSGNAIWIGEAIGLSREADPGLSSQFLLRSLIRQVPVTTDLVGNLAISSGYLGLGFVIASTDGSHFRPVISHVDPTGPAANAGLFEGEVITAIEGYNTLNHSTAAISALLAGQPGNTITLTVDRSAGPVELAVTYGVRRDTR